MHSSQRETHTHTHTQDINTHPREANSIASAYTPHPCTSTGATRCSSPTECGDGDEFREQGLCDKSGCDFNSYRMGDTTFYGAGLTVDTTKPFTLVTQFITDDNTADGTLVEIKRFYVQDGVTIPNSQSQIEGVEGNSITDSFCEVQKTAFNDKNDFKTKGGLAQMGAQLKNMVLVLSIWDDYAVSMNWLDSTYPPEASGPGAVRGPCDPAAGLPETVEAAHPDATVIYSNIKIGAINSTFTA